MDISIKSDDFPSLYQESGIKDQVSGKPEWFTQDLEEAWRINNSSGSSSEDSINDGPKTGSVSPTMTQAVFDLNGISHNPGLYTDPSDAGGTVYSSSSVVFNSGPGSSRAKDNSQYNMAIEAVRRGKSDDPTKHQLLSLFEEDPSSATGIANSAKSGATNTKDEDPTVKFSDVPQADASFIESEGSSQHSSEDISFSQSEEVSLTPSESVSQDSSQESAYIPTISTVSGFNYSIFNDRNPHTRDQLSTIVEDVNETSAISQIVISNDNGAAVNMTMASLFNQNLLEESKFYDENDSGLFASDVSGSGGELPDSRERSMQHRELLSAHTPEQASVFDHSTASSNDPSSAYKAISDLLLSNATNVNGTTGSRNGPRQLTLLNPSSGLMPTSLLMGLTKSISENTDISHMNVSSSNVSSLSKNSSMSTSSELSTADISIPPSVFEEGEQTDPPRVPESPLQNKATTSEYQQESKHTSSDECTRVSVQGVSEENRSPTPDVERENSIAFVEEGPSIAIVSPEESHPGVAVLPSEETQPDEAVLNQKSPVMTFIDEEKEQEAEEKDEFPAPSELDEGYLVPINADEGNQLAQAAEVDESSISELPPITEEGENSITEITHDSNDELDDAAGELDLDNVVLDVNLEHIRDDSVIAPETYDDSSAPSDISLAGDDKENTPPTTSHSSEEHHLSKLVENEQMRPVLRERDIIVEDGATESSNNELGSQRERSAVQEQMSTKERDGCGPFGQKAELRRATGRGSRLTEPITSNKIKTSTIRNNSNSKMYTETEGSYLTKTPAPRRSHVIKALPSVTDHSFATDSSVMSTSTATDMSSTSAMELPEANRVMIQAISDALNTNLSHAHNEIPSTASSPTELPHDIFGKTEELVRQARNYKYGQPRHQENGKEQESNHTAVASHSPKESRSISILVESLENSLSPLPCQSMLHLDSNRSIVLSERDSNKSMGTINRESDKRIGLSEREINEPSEPSPAANTSGNTENKDKSKDESVLASRDPSIPEPKISHTAHRVEYNHTKRQQINIQTPMQRPRIMSSQAAAAGDNTRRVLHDYTPQVLQGRTYSLFSATGDVDQKAPAKPLAVTRAAEVTHAAEVARPAEATRAALSGNAVSFMRSSTLKILIKHYPGKDEWSKLQSVDLSGKHMETMVYLPEYLPMVDQADFSHNAIDFMDSSSLPPLLRSLNLSHNLLSSQSIFMDLYRSSSTALQAFTSRLERLDLSNNRNITTLAPLRVLTNLVDLRLDNNKLSSVEFGASVVEPLSGMVGLKKLSLRGCKLQGMIDVGSLVPTLVKLDLSNNAITELSNLEHLTKLRELRLASNELESFEHAMPLLQGLTLRKNTGLTRVNLTALPRIRHLDLDYCDCDLDTHSLNISSELPSFTPHLEKLSMRFQMGRRNESIDPHAFHAREARMAVKLNYYLRDVKTLRLSGNKINLEQLFSEPFYHLEVLDIELCGVAALPYSFSAVVPNLRKLNLSNNTELNSIVALSGMSRIHTLKLVGTDVPSAGSLFHVIRTLPEMVELDTRYSTFCREFYSILVDDEDRHSYATQDNYFRRSLSNFMLFRRRFYRANTISVCKHLKKLDGLDCGEERLSVASFLQKVDQAASGSSNKQIIG